MTCSIKPFFTDNKKIVPVISINDAKNALPLADTLAECGFTVLEITLRTPCAIDAIAEIHKHRPNITVGAGTVKNTLQLQTSIDAGAQFIVCPGIDAVIIEKSIAQAVPIVPGIMTPSELMLAENCGLDVVKLFPAGLAGGKDFIRSIHPVFPDLQFFPTGGITEDTVHEYLSLDAVVCAGGTWLTPASLVDAQDWAHIHAIAQRC